MTKAEIEKLVRWDEYGIGRFALFVPLLGRELQIELFAKGSAAPVVSDKMVATVNDVLALGPEDLGRVKELLWEECNFAFEVSDYGVKALPGETPLQAHLRELGLAGPDDAYDQSEVKAIRIADEHEGRYAAISVVSASENLVSIIVKNGRIIDFDDAGAYLGFFDEDEQHARKRRQETLGG